MEKIRVIAVVGPTASGKTDLAVELALKYGGEVVCADSMQIYKYFNIATAKPTEAEMRGVPHHIVDFVEPTESYNVSKYVKLASETVKDIHDRGKLPIVCGGTGLFVDSLLDNIQFTETGEDHAYRQELRRRAEKYGAQSLLDELAEYDPESANRLHPNNLGRIIRAMECYKLSGITITEQNRLSRLRPNPYESLYIGINFKDRQKLYDRIDRRVDVMLENGLVEEAKWYFEQSGFKTASSAIGYKELKPYFEGSMSIEQAVDNLKRATRRFAKRQLTWFRRNESVNWIYADAQVPLTVQAQEIIKEKFSF